RWQRVPALRTRRTRPVRDRGDAQQNARSALPLRAAVDSRVRDRDAELGAERTLRSAHRQHRAGLPGRHLRGDERRHREDHRHAAHDARRIRGAQPGEVRRLMEGAMSTTLGYEVFIAEPIPQNVTELVPNGDRRMFSPLSITLIHGENDVDELMPTHTTAREFFNAMLERYPKRLNPGAVWSGAKALYT